MPPTPSSLKETIGRALQLQLQCATVAQSGRPRKEEGVRETACCRRKHNWPCAGVDNAYSWHVCSTTDDPFGAPSPLGTITLLVNDGVASVLYCTPCMRTRRRRCRSFDYGVSHEISRCHQRPAGNSDRSQRRHQGPFRPNPTTFAVYPIFFVKLIYPTRVVLSTRQTS